LGEEKPGTRLVHIGDVGRTENLVEPSRDADTLVIEATYLQEEAEMASDFAHITARQAAELARRAGVKHLILTHISRRYRERDVLEEAQATFKESWVARDFDAFQVRRGECKKIERSA
jgi:ribonuclease Z